MTRLPLLLALLASIAACKPDDKPKEASPSNGGKQAQQNPKPEPVAPVGGISNIQESHDDLIKEIEKQEARQRSGEGVDTRLLQGQLKLADNLIKACEMAVANEAEQIVRRRYAQMTSEFAKMHARRGEIGEEIVEVKGILENIKAGGRVPEGFTEDELRDRLADLEKEMEKQGEKIEDYKIELRKYEDVIASGKFESPADGTVFTQELDALKKTRDRVKALLP